MKEKKSKKGIWTLRILFGLLTLGCCVYIFVNSAENAAKSASRSHEITEKLSPVLIEDYENLTPPQKTREKSLLESRLRSSAHGMEFAALGMCSAAFALTFLGGKRKKTAAALLPLAAFAFCVLYALTDEAHQLLVPGRTFQWEDLLIDSVGAFIGILLVAAPVLIVSAMRRDRKNAGGPTTAAAHEEGPSAESENE